MKVFCDTSGFFALLHKSDRNHALAADGWRLFLDRGYRLVTSNYVLTEMIALVQARIGLPGVRQLLGHVDAVVETLWIDQQLHEIGVHDLLGEPRRQVSFVDRTSFALMRRHRIEHSFAFDSDFTRLGFGFPT